MLQIFARVESALQQLLHQPQQQPLPQPLLLLQLQSQLLLVLHLLLFQNVMVIHVQLVHNAFQRIVRVESAALIAHLPVTDFLTFNAPSQFNVLGPISAPMASVNYLQRYPIVKNQVEEIKVALAQMTANVHLIYVTKVFAVHKDLLLHKLAPPRVLISDAIMIHAPAI